jgi:fibroblast growth factor receptor substrate 2
VGNGDAITTNISVETMSCTQTYLTPSYINADLGAGVEPVSPTCSLNGESTYACHNLTNESKQCHLYMNVIPGPENGVSAAPDKPPATIWPKPALPCSGMRQQEWELEESRHCYANLEPGEIEVARSHIPKRVSGTERVPPLLLLSPTVQSQQNPLTSPPGVAETLNYIELNLEQNKTDSVAGNVNSPVGSVPPATLSVPPDSPRRGAEGYATIDYDRTAALSHSVNPNVYYDCEGLRRTRHNSNINDPVAPSTRLSSSD